METNPLSAGSILDTDSKNIWLHRRIYYLASGFMFAAAALRAYLVFKESLLLNQILLLLGAWLLTFIVNALLAQKFPWLSTLLIGLEVFTILQLLRLSHTDFFAFLFAISSMQAMQQFTVKEASVWIGLTTLLTFLSLYQPFGIFYAIAIAVVFFGGSVFLVTYIGSTRRASLIQQQQQALVIELEQANRQLESSSHQLQQLAAGRERQRLARELHDSVTQTIFSMTLTTQSALMLLERDRSQVAAQLERLDQLARSSLSEMQVLISKLAPENTGGFVSALQQHLDERRRLDNLSVNLDVDGSQPLTAAEEQSLFRIAQEALNNIVKHAGVTQAAIHLHLDGQPWLEIEDQGIGFDPQQAKGGGRVGLVSMQERAAEIGWSLREDSSPGNGTRIRVRKDSGG
jgi:signal transduction histidine kinase